MDELGKSTFDLEEFGLLQLEEPWRVCGPGLERELRRECSSSHVLHGRAAVSIARRSDCDDVLFLLPEHDPPLAVVHLTYRVESGSDFPSVVFFESIEDWIERCMKRDHDEWS